VRVVDVTQWYGPRSGGIRTYLHAKARFAAERDLEHALILPRPGPGTRRIEGSRVRALPSVPTGQAAGYRLIPNARAIVAALSDLDPSVVVVHDATSFPRAICRWAGNRGIPVVAIVHSDLEIGATGLPTIARVPVRGVLRHIQGRGLSGPDVILAASDTTQRRITGRGTSPVLLAPLGVDLEAFECAEPDEDLRRELAPPDARLLFHAGRLSPEKRPELLIETLARLDASHRIAIAGEGSAVPALKRLALRRGVAGRVIFLGHVADRSRIATLMATADCFLHVNPDEPYGLAPLEALAAGSRLVIPETSGVAAQVGHRGAVLVLPDDPGALADGVRRALSAPRPQPALGDLTWDRTFEREWALYRSLLVRAAA
jgi:alpha-1,6-mannosyltransferase